MLKFQSQRKKIIPFTSVYIARCNGNDFRMLETCSNNRISIFLAYTMQCFRRYYSYSRIFVLYGLLI